MKKARPTEVGTSWKLGRNERCHCGSGRKYKHCHLRDDEAQGLAVVVKRVTPPDSLNALRANTLDFIAALKESLGITFDPARGGTIRTDISPSMVRAVHERARDVFPRFAPYAAIHADIAKSGFPGLYWGLPDSDSIATHIARYALYAEKIIVSNPFCSPMLFHVDSSPLQKPEEWIQITVNRALFLCSLEEWIREGVIILLPPLAWSDYALVRDELQPLATRRVDAFSDATMHQLAVYSMMEMLLWFGPDDVAKALHTILGHKPDPSLADAARMLVEREYRRNPARYHWTHTTAGGNATIMETGTGNSLEAALATADLCGGFLLLGGEWQRREYDLAIEAGVVKARDLAEVSRAFADVHFDFLNSVRLDFVLDARREGRLSRLRNYLERLWRTASDSRTRPEALKEFGVELRDQYEDYKKDWKAISRKAGTDFMNAVVGGGLAFLSGQLDYRVALGGVATFGLKALLDARRERSQLERLPLAVFLKLDAK